MRNLIAAVLLALCFVAACSSGAKKAALPENAESLPASMLQKNEAAVNEEAGERDRAAFSNDVASGEDAAGESAESYEITTSSEETKEYVDSFFYSQNRNLIAPKILISSDDAFKVNADIQNHVRELAGESEDNGNYMTYRAILNGNVLSVLIQEEIYDKGEFRFISYNFDISTGALLTIDDMFERAGMSPVKALDIFEKERALHWSSIAKQRGESLNTYKALQEKELGYLETAYKNKNLAIILDEDGLINVVCVLMDVTDSSYWQLYCMTENRTKSLQRNYYGGEFAAVLIESPTEEELKNIKIVKKIIPKKTEDSESKKYLLLPLWENLSFQWFENKDSFGEKQVEEVQWRTDELLGEDAIYIELSQKHVEENRYFAVIEYNKENFRFYLNEKETLNGQYDIRYLILK